MYNKPVAPKQSNGISPALKVAIVHDFSWGMRGAERCLEAFCEMFPQADIYMMFGNVSTLSSSTQKHTIRFSFLQKIPLLKKFYRYTYFLWPFAIESFDLNGYDLIISSSSTVAKGVLTPPESLHISYMYTPMRYAWGQMHSYFTPRNFAWWKRIFIHLFLHYLRVWDVASTARVDKIVAISDLSKRRIEKCYRRKVDNIIHPPVELVVTDIVALADRDDYYMAIAPFEPNKGGRLLIEVAQTLGIRLKIIGDGSMKKELTRLAKKSGDKIEFLGWVSELEKVRLLKMAKGCIFCGVEEFGIAAVEAIACGTPVVTYKHSGTAEIVGDSQTGVVFEGQNVESVSKALERLDKQIENGVINAENVAIGAKVFSKERFKEEFMVYCNSVIKLVSSQM